MLGQPSAARVQNLTDPGWFSDGNTLYPRIAPSLEQVVSNTVAKRNGAGDGLGQMSQEWLDRQ